MGLVSTHEGIFKWLVSKKVLGEKRKNKGKVDLIVKAYKAETGNPLSMHQFYPNQTFGERWNKSQKEFKQFVEWARTKYNLS